MTILKVPLNKIKQYIAGSNKIDIIEKYLNKDLFKLESG